jgi:hypothetical protein
MKKSFMIVVLLVTTLFVALSTSEDNRSNNKEKKHPCSDCSCCGYKLNNYTFTEWKKCNTCDGDGLISCIKYKEQEYCVEYSKDGRHCIKTKTMQVPYNAPDCQKCNVCDGQKGRYVITGYGCICPKCNKTYTGCESDD